MSSLKDILLSIDESLKSIALSLEKLNSTSSPDEKLALSSNENDEEIVFGDEINPDHKESQLFMDITGVYINEEMERQRAGKSKKAARRVSVKLGEVLVQFFSNELSNSIMDLKIERSKIGGLIIFTVEETPIAVLKFLTDLGYSRGERFYEVIQEVQNLAEDVFGVEKDNVFFLISSLFNGIEKSYVEKMIGETLESNQVFLLNKQQVQLFINNYINKASSYEDPRSNIYFMAADIHPNNLANDFLDDKDGDYYLMIDNVNHYDWLSSIETLVDQIKEIAKATLMGGNYHA
ncbi:hypothetical protein V7152_13020 [Neobacillus drentensis]|uniref:hypothetical protein n=1 Tax=Neobacillus drentensis TaxID=220684 RepID=UPI0030001FB2